MEIRWVGSVKKEKESLMKAVSVKTDRRFGGTLDMQSK